jgi:hypothetical protein
VHSDDLNAYHVACILISDAVGLVVRNLHTYNCEVFDVELGVFADGQLSNVLVENNMLGNAANPYPSDASLGLNTDTKSWNGLTVRNNSVVVPMRHPVCSGGCTNVRYSGNISPLRTYSPFVCVAEVTYRHNVWYGGTDTCDPTDIAVATPGFVNAASNDLHLVAGAAAIDAGDPSSFPADDIDGDRRPLGPAPDAGADELR